MSANCCGPCRLSGQVDGMCGLGGMLALSRCAGGLWVFVVSVNDMSTVVGDLG